MCEIVRRAANTQCYLGSVSPNVTVTHVTFSTRGGAGFVANELDAALVALGVDSRVFSNGDIDLRTSPLAHPIAVAASILDEKVVRDPAWLTPVTLSRNYLTGTQVLREIDKSSIVHLHWTHGIIDLESLAKIKKPVVWTLHDMRPLTGGCHQKLDCSQHSRECTKCPAVRAPFRQAVHRQRMRIMELIDAKRDLTFVAPSLWMKNKLLESLPCLDGRIKVVHHGIDLPLEKPLSLAVAKSERTVRVAVVGGVYQSPLKGVLNVEPIIERMARELDVTVFGASKVGIKGVKHVPPSSRDNFLRLLACHDAVLIPSLAESFSLVALEASRLGLTVFGAADSAIQEVASEYGRFRPLREDLDIRTIEHKKDLSPSKIRSAKDMALDYLEIYDSYSL